MFDAKRFARLARAHWAEQRKAYARFLGVGIVLHIVMLIIVFASENPYLKLRTEGQGATWFFGLFVLAPIFAGRYFQQMGRRESALLVLMRPASVFEKWLLAVLCIVVAYPLAYTLAFYLVDVPAWLVAHGQATRAAAESARLVAAGENVPYPLRDIKLEDYALFVPISAKMTWEDLAQVMVFLTSLQAFALFGSLYFRGSPFIKTLFAGFLALLALMLVAAVFKGNADLLFDYWHTERPLSGFQSFAFPIVWMLVPLLLWLSTWLALREREVSP